MIKISAITIEKVLDVILDDLGDQGIDEALDTDEVDGIIEQIRISFNYLEGNLSKDEYEELCS
jgi:hypothetical protein